MFVTIGNFDFGLMKKHEDNAANGDLFTPGGEEFREMQEEDKTANPKGKVADLVLPVAVLIVSAVLAMIYLQRKNEEEKQVSIPACISAYLGVTEPALFGVNLKYGFPFICGMIGSGIAAVISVASGVMANAIGIGGIPGILSIQPQHMLMFAVAMVVAIVVPFVLTVIVGRKKLS